MALKKFAEFGIKKEKMRYFKILFYQILKIEYGRC